VLTTTGTVSHEEALDWAHAQYDAFAERRRLEAETEASARYIEDLNATARLLERGAPDPAAPAKPRRPRKKKGPR